MPRPRLHDDALRTRLLEVASEVVSTAGPAALTVRDAARRAGTSSSAVYALFGSREQLLVAVAEEGFRRFGEHLAAVPRTPDPAADLFALGLAYRRSALADPHFYRVMFDVAPGTTGSAPPWSAAAGPPTLPLAAERERPGATGSAVTARPTFRALRDAVARLLPPTAEVVGTGEGPAGQDLAGEVALVLWAQVHGMVTLELAGLLPGAPDDRSARYEGALRAVGRAALGV